MQSVFAILASLTVVSEQTTMMNDCWDVMNHIYVRQYIYIVFNFGMIAQQIYSLGSMITAYTIESNIKNNFAYRDEPEIAIKM